MLEDGGGFWEYAGSAVHFSCVQRFSLLLGAAEWLATANNRTQEKKKTMYHLLACSKQGSR